MEDLGSSFCTKELSSDLDWARLPVEIWLQIFGDLPQSTLLFVVRYVCRFFKSLTFDPSLWRKIDLNKWKENTTLSFLQIKDSVLLAEDEETDADMRNIVAKLLKYGDLSSTDLFTPVISRVSKSLLSMSFSRYTGDFVFGSHERSLLYECSNIVCLDLAFCDNITTPILDEISLNCEKIETLILQGCSEVNDDAMKAVSTFKHLTKLDISHCAAVTDVGINFLAGMPCRILHFLSDGVLHLSDWGVLNLVSHQTEIECLVLDGEDLTDISVIVSCRHLANLQKFQMSFCSKLTDQSILALCGKVRLQRLHLRKISSQVSTQALVRLFQEEPLANLRDLAICDTEHVNDDVINTISSGCPLLQRIHLDWCCEASDKSISELFQLCRELEHVSLVGLVRLKGPWLINVDHHLPKLRHLDLSLCNDIPDAQLYKLVLRKRDIVAYTYFHERITFENVLEHVDEEHERSSKEPHPNPFEEECPGSRGATVEF
ncbi:unnamed protein product [Clavelina lepadiformis]|uniref:F-box domain-containing protein n=1 Tax=Clavelina lepadiformis TaxID=159417 RepID=A0ABP0FIM6_CLALP